INSDDYLKDHKGQVAKRNGARAPWVSQLDLSFRQEIPGIFQGNKGEIRLDFYNFTNLLNKNWGVEYRAGFPLVRQLADSAGVDPDTGKYIYDISGSKYQHDGKYSPAKMDPNESNNPSQRWSVLMTLRYTF
ncbi:MAG TPA: Oar protein, partial [Rhodanobacteraceae bacterium]|nr:Oar protein [Rhodanobacteraceae bacterium]